MKKPLPFISVVIPAYNEEAYLPRCLHALQYQTYPKKNYSVLVVDNNSTDKTAHIARTFGAEVITEKQQGHVYSLNAGLQYAKGDILAITDADTEVAENWLETLAETFENPQVVGVTGSIRLDLKSELNSALITRLYDLFLYFNFALKKPHLTGPNMAIRKSAFKKIKQVDTRYKIGGDVEIGMRLRKHGKVKFSKTLSVTASSRRFKGEFTSFLKDLSKYTMAYVYAIWLEKPPKDKLKPIR